MMKYGIVSVVSGFLFIVIDVIINANPLAQNLYAVYSPIAKTSVNIPAGILIDLAYGFIVAGVFLILYKGLPGKTGLGKGISFALIVWFFRVIMSSAPSWMILNIQLPIVLYTLVTGLGEMLVIGSFYGLTLYQVGEQSARSQQM